MMNFVHFGDSHLGGSNFKLREREQDFLDSFKQVIDYCVKERPSFIIHSGDLFDKGRPSHDTVIFLINELKRLKELSIPFFIVPGSHDVSADGTFISVLESVGLLVNVARPENFIKGDNEVIMKGVAFGKVAIYGVPGRRSNIKAVYEMLRPKLAGDFRVFVFHHTLSSVMGSESFADIPLSLLPKGMDYYAGGHWHEHDEFFFDGKPVIYPGSLDFTDIDSMEKGKRRGFIHYKDGPVFVPVKSREVKVLRVDCEGLSPDGVVSKCLELIPKSINGLLIVRLTGVLGSGKRSEVDISLISSKALSNGFIHCNIKVSDLINPDSAFINSSSNVSEVERDFLKSKGYSDSEVFLARELITLLGNDLPASELAKVIKQAEALL